MFIRSIYFSYIFFAYFLHLKWNMYLSWEGRGKRGQKKRERKRHKVYIECKTKKERVYRDTRCIGNERWRNGGRSRTWKRGGTVEGAEGNENEKKNIAGTSKVTVRRTAGSYRLAIKVDGDNNGDILLSTAFFNPAATTAAAAAAAVPVLVRLLVLPLSPNPSFAVPCPPVPSFRRSERADALVWPASARLAVNGSLNPPPRRLLSRCWPVSSKPRDLSPFVNATPRGPSRLHADRTPGLFFPLRLSPSWPRSYPPRPRATNAHSREFQRRVPIPEGRAIPMGSPPRSAIRLLAEYECTETDGRCVSATGVYVRVRAPHCAPCVCVRDWMRGNCQWNCPQLRRRNTRVVFIGWRLIVVSDGEQGSTVPQVFKVEGRTQWEREWKFGIFFSRQTNIPSFISLKNWLQSVAWLLSR